MLAATSQLFIYCLGGTKITDSVRITFLFIRHFWLFSSSFLFIYFFLCFSFQSLQIRDAIYFLNWYNCNKRVRYQVLMMMMRQNKPTDVSVPFFKPSLYTLTTVRFPLNYIFKW